MKAHPKGGEGYNVYSQALKFDHQGKEEGRGPHIEVGLAHTFICAPRLAQLAEQASQ